MEKRIGQITEAFQHYRFDQTLRLIDQLLKKHNKDKNKNASQISGPEMRLLLLLKVGSLISLGNFHLSNKIYRQNIAHSQQSIEAYSKEVPFLFLSIAELFLDDRENELLDSVCKSSSQETLNTVLRFYINKKAFAQLSKHFLKDFMSTKNSISGLAQIYLEYLHNLQKQNSIHYTRLNVVRSNQKLNLKLIGMFLDKFCQTLPDKRNKQGAQQDKIAEQLSKVQDAKQLLQQEKAMLQRLQKPDKGQQQKVNKQLKLNELAVKDMYQRKQAHQALMKMTGRLFQHSKLLRLKLLLNQGKQKEAITFFSGNRQDIKQTFMFIRSIYKLLGQKQRGILNEKSIKLKAFYLAQFSLVFRKNLDLQVYTPLYDYYNQFLQQIMCQINAQSASRNRPTELNLLQAKMLNKQQMYVFTGCGQDNTLVLSTYFHSLMSQYKFLIDKSDPSYQANTKSDYYRICLKGLLLQLIKISDMVEMKQTLFYLLQQYHYHFRQTLTYPVELRRHWRALVNQNILCSADRPIQRDGELVSQINYVKVSIGLSLSNKINEDKGENQKLMLQNVSKTINQLQAKYSLYLNTVQKSRKLQKGQRYISDQFLIILADYARAYIESDNSDQAQAEAINVYLAHILEKAVKVSPYNADLRVRYMHVCSILSYHQLIAESFLALDIKSVQMETMAYWIVRPIIEFGLGEQYDKILAKMVRSYQENARQTSQYSLKSLKNCALDRVEEYVCYRDNISASYSKCIMLYSLYIKNKLEQGSQQYLMRIHHRIAEATEQNKPFSLNCDAKVLDNQLVQNYVFADFYGIHTNCKVLSHQVSVRLAEHWLLNTLLNRNNPVSNSYIKNIAQEVQKASQLSPKDIVDFQTFQFFDQQIKKQLKKGTKEYQNIANCLQNYKNLLGLKANSVWLVQKLHRIIQSGIKSAQASADQLEKLQASYIQSLSIGLVFIQKLSFRAQVRSIFTFRSYLLEAASLFNLLVQEVSRNKKLKPFKEIVNASCLKCYERTIESLTSFRFSGRIPINAEFFSESITDKDRQLEKVLAIDPREVKKVLMKYAASYSL